MKAFPSFPPVEEAPASLFETGHLWIQELVDGLALRFQLQDSGLLIFGDDTTVFRADEPPVQHSHAVRCIREQFDRDGFRSTVDDPELVVFFGVATVNQGIAYDWDRLPAFLGHDIWSSRRDAFLPPDAVETAFTNLGLKPVNAINKERRAADIDPQAYDLPASAWYDGPVAGVVFRNKTGLRAKRHHSTPANVTTASLDASMDDLARQVVTPDRIEAAIEAMEERAYQPTVETVRDRVVETAVREHYSQRFHEVGDADMTTFRTAVTRVVQRYLADSDP
jgi:hypothetical protein